MSAPSPPSPAPKPTPEEIAARKAQADAAADKIVEDGIKAFTVAAKLTRAVAHAHIDPKGAVKKIFRALFADDEDEKRSHR